MNENSVFIEILRQNWNHMRHQETLRMWIGNVFIAIVVGALAYLGKAGLKEPGYIPFVFITISMLCLLMTLKTNKVFVETKNSIIQIFKDGKINLGSDWRKYVGMLESSGIWKILRIRCLYVALYTITIIGSVVWIILAKQE